MHDLPPEAGGAVEVEEPARARARGLFEQQVAVEEHRLHAGQQRVGAVEVAPAGLDHADARIGEEMDRLVEDVRAGQEVGVEDENVIPLRLMHPVLQRPALKPVRSVRWM